MTFNELRVSTKTVVRGSEMKLSPETRTKISATKHGRPSGAEGRLWPTASRLKISVNRTGLIGRKRKVTSSQYVGVAWDKKRQLWNTQIRIAGVNVYCGRHSLETEAGRAIDAALVERGLAPINFITDTQRAKNP
jgi:hypothetical protein